MSGRDISKEFLGVSSIPDFTMKNIFSPGGNEGWMIGCQEKQKEELGEPNVSYQTLEIILQ